jgi:RHS repeat-associated protein
VSPEPTRYVCDGDDVVADLDSSNNVKVRYLTPGLDDNLFMLVKDGEDWVRYWYFHDGLGSVRQVLDDAGNVKAAYDYQAFGEPYNWLESFPEGVENRYTYTGREWNAESELSHYRARDLNPFLGRFGQRDPADYSYEMVQDINLYLYCWLNPVSFTDPSGEKCCCDKKTWLCSSDLEGEECRKARFCLIVGHNKYYLLSKSKIFGWLSTDWTDSAEAYLQNRKTGLIKQCCDAEVYRHPSREEFKTLMKECDSWWFIGHSKEIPGVGRALIINEKEGGFFDIDDFKRDATVMLS